MFDFGHTSRNRLQGVHPDLIICCKAALSYGVVDFSVVQGLRTNEQQEELYAQGRTKPGKIVTWTMNSKHLAQEDGYSHAVDLAPFVDGGIDWNNISNFDILATLMFRAAMDTGVRIGWGGHWKKTKDRPHFELLKGEQT